MTVRRRNFLAGCALLMFQLSVLAVASMIGIACGGSPVRPQPGGSSSPVPVPPAPLSSVGTIVVDVLPFFSSSNPCTWPGTDPCPRGTVIIDAYDRFKTFTGPGKLTWEDIPAGSHTLDLQGGYFLPDATECGFFWQLADGWYWGAPLQVVLQGGQTQAFQVSFVCI